MSAVSVTMNPARLSIYRGGEGWYVGYATPVGTVDRVTEFVISLDEARRLLAEVEAHWDQLANTL